MVLWAKDWIGDAVSASPQASVVWAGLCLVLPLLTSPHTANEANRDGFTYVTTRIRFYTALEPLLQTPRPNQAAAEIQERLVDLYENILSFQVQSILRFYHSRLKGYVKDLAQKTDWKKMQDDIKALEATINGDLDRMSEFVSVQELSRLNKTSTDYLQKMESLLSVSEQQLDVSKAHLGVSQVQLTVTEELRDIAQKQLQTQQAAMQQNLTDEQKKCLHLFRLTSSNKDITYEWYKNRVETRIENTCQWFLQHEDFRKWLDQKSAPLLVSADPGCGKSVLAKYLIDHELPAKSIPGTSICYFFFKNQDQNTARQALCALLHQLFSQNLGLIDNAMDQFESDGPGLVNSTSSLWEIFTEAVHDPRAGPVTVVLDALDECAVSEFCDLMTNLKSQYPYGGEQGSQLKIIMMSRPYKQILSEFQPLLQQFPHVHIPGEEESAIISKEVNSVIEYRVDQLAREKLLSQKLKTILSDKLLGIEHRTYLWVHLVFNYLKNAILKKTEKGIEDAISEMPQTVNDAYEAILARSENRSEVRRILAVILAADEPLTLSEMNVAINIKCDAAHPGSIDDLDLENEDDFKARLRLLCGLFVSISDRRIYLIHLTAREFLLRPDALPSLTAAAHTLPSTLRTLPPSMATWTWHNSISMREAHTIISEICILYLNCLGHNTVSSSESDARMCLLRYAVWNWAEHFRQANVGSDEAITSIALDMYDSSKSERAGWIPTLMKNPGLTQRHESVYAGLLAASYLGHSACIKLLLQRGAEIEVKDVPRGNTPLLWASEKGHGAVVRQLLDAGATVDSQNRRNETSLLLATNRGHFAIVEQLLEAGADVHARDKTGETALFVASSRGDEAVVKLLLKYGSDPNTAAKYGKTPLMEAIEFNHGSIISLYLHAGADIHAADAFGGTALSYSIEFGREIFVKQLLAAGSDVNHKKNDGQTPLCLGAPYENVVQCLLSAGAIVEPDDLGVGPTPLMEAAARGNGESVKMLLEAGANVHRVDENGMAALSHGVVDEEVTRLLLCAGADVERKDTSGMTPLMRAAEEGASGAARLLLEAGVNVHHVSANGMTALLYGACDEEVSQLLLTAGAAVDWQNKSGSTALMIAAEQTEMEVVRLLLGAGANVHLVDTNGMTALLHGASDKRLAQLLVAAGADVNWQSKSGTTPLMRAAEKKQSGTVRLLLEAGANVHLVDENGMTALSYWAKDEEATRLLLVAGAVVDSQTKLDLRRWCMPYGAT